MAEVGDRAHVDDAFVCWWNISEVDAMNPEPEMPPFGVVAVDNIDRISDLNLQGMLYQQWHERRHKLGIATIPIVLWPSGRYSHLMQIRSDSTADVIVQAAGEEI